MYKKNCNVINKQEIHYSTPTVSKIDVLLCEDSQVAKTIISQFLSKNLHNLHIAKDGKQGLELFKLHRPQLIISDIHMPKMNGVKMGKAIKEIDPNVNIILMSKDDESEILHKIIDIRKFLKKPFDPTILMDDIVTITSNIEKKELIQPKVLPSHIGVLENKKLDNDDLENKRLCNFVSHFMKDFNKVEYVRRIDYPFGEVSGDFHAVVNNGQLLYIMLADGCGHGLSAILPALQIPKTFRNLAMKGYSILTIADEINRILFEQKIVEHFVATTLMCWDSNTGCIQVLNCGNPTALLVNDKGEIIREFKSNTLALGTVNNTFLELPLNHFQYNLPARLYLYTDGLPDTIDEFGIDKKPFSFKEIVYKTKTDEIFETVSHLIDSTLKQGQADDLTLLEVSLEKKNQIKDINLCRRENTLIPDIDTDENRAILKKSSTLIIDNNTNNTKAYEPLKRIVGKVNISPNRIEGMKLITEHNPSTIIFNIDELGIEEMAYLKEINNIPSHSTLIIVSKCTGVKSTYIDQLVQFGVHNYLEYPVPIDKLLNVILSCSYKQKDLYNSYLTNSIFTDSALAMSITNENNLFIAVNKSFCRITGYTEEEVIGRNPNILSSGKHDLNFYRDMWNSINTNYKYSGEVWNQRKNGDLFLEWISVNAITNEQGKITHYSSIFADITERNHAESKIKKLTYQDDLTGLPNRLLFMERISQELIKAERYKQKLAILFLDMDNFKNVNDTLGHDTGDKVLIEASKRLNSCIRKSDTACRFGGDEFVVCLSNINLDESADLVAQKIIKEFTRPFEITDDVFYLSISIGITIYPDDALSIQDLLKQGDQAMYAAKEKGGNNACYYEASMQEKVMLRKEMIQNLKIAISENQFSIHYQPIVELATEEIYKAEALIRWDHPSLGFIPPSKFIPIAEDTDMINEIGDWVFKNATLQALKWQTKFNPNFQISINKSPKQFERNDNDWLGYLDQMQISPSNIIIEITEGLLMDFNDSNATQLLNYRKRGVQIGLDDFGTGYSSLSYLKKLDIDYIKIDRTFVKNLTHNSDDKVLCEAIIVMAHKLGIKTIAEGIETESQKQILLEAGCDYGQGYLFSKPITAEDFEKRLNKPVTYFV